MIKKFKVSHLCGAPVVLNMLVHAPENIKSKFVEYGYLRKNPAGIHRELWYHEQGDRSWLVVTRNTVTHEILKVELARNLKRKVNAK